MIVPKQKKWRDGHGEDGFILVITMLILVVLSIIGISATNLTELELKIAGNDRVHKETFYRADGGTEVGLRLQYDNAICSYTKGGFAANYDGTPKTKRLIGDGIVVTNLEFAKTEPPTGTDTIASLLKAGNREMIYYPGVVLDPSGAPSYTTFDSQPHTDLRTYNQTKITPGSGLQMVAGYEGLGAGLAAGGAHKLFTVAALHSGELESESLVTIQWQMSTHIINNADKTDCNY